MLKKFLFKLFNSHDTCSNISIGGKTIKVSGKSVSVINGKVIVDGKEITDLSNSGIPAITIIVEGNTNSIEVDVANTVTVHGNAEKVSSVSGDIHISGHISGTVSSVSGDILAKEIKGNVSTVSGDISNR